MNRAADWLRQAERDLQAAENSAAPGFHEWAAFGAQQSAGKSVKALIQHLHGEERGHSITGLLRELPEQVVVPDDVLEAAQHLDQVYLTSRYPNGFAAGAPSDYFTEKMTQRFLHYARAIFSFCRGQIH